MTKTVAFETKCYEGDWQAIVTERHLRPVPANCRHRFDRTALYLKSSTDHGAVTRGAEQLVSANVIDEYRVVEEHAACALEAFDLAGSSFRVGYH